MTRQFKILWALGLTAALLPLAGAESAALAAPGDVYNLGTLGGSISSGFAINDAGQVAGESDTTGDTARYAFRYSGTPGSGGAMADLGTLGGTYTGGYAINDAGQVAGWSYLTGDTAPHAFRYTGIPGSGGAMEDLGTFGGTNSQGFGINNAGQVVGGAYLAGNTDFHAFRYAGTPGLGGAMADLGTLGGTSSIGYAINNSGQVAGLAYTTDTTHAFRYTGTPGAGGAMADLGTLGGTFSVGYAINNSGQVAGVADTSGNAAYHAFRYTGIPGFGGAMVDLGPGVGRAINDAGFVVGDGASAITLWQTDAANTAVDLDAWLDATNPTQGDNWSLFTALGINNHGLITGYGYFDDGPNGQEDGPRAYILDASRLVGVPEPSSFALLALVAPALAVRRNRRITNLLCT